MSSNLAREIAHTLVTEQLCACVNIMPQCESFYMWEQKMKTDVEHILMIKTTIDKYSKLQQRIIDLHPYELPEIIACNIDHGLPQYLKWLQQ